MKQYFKVLGLPTNANLEEVKHARNNLLKKYHPDCYKGSISFAEEKTIAQLEKNIARVNSVTGLLEQGYTPETMLSYLLEDMEMTINDTIDASFYCNCSKERVSRALISVGKKELKSMINDGKPVELNCHF